MKTEKLQFDLPAELIAQQPLPVRSESRLLVLNRANGELTDSKFKRLGDFLLPGDCLVLNDTRVLPARFFARRASGAKLEGLFLAETEPGIWEVMLKGARRIRTGEKFYLLSKAKADFCIAQLLAKKSDGSCQLKVQAQPDCETILNRVGFPPLPPYIKRDDDPSVAAQDRLRYQTVYARRDGAVAAPTAGLHFTDELLEQLKERGIRFAFLTLHVGAGTFKPITTENLQDHQVHQEPFGIDEENARAINETKSKGGRIIAVGTTSTRALETVALPTSFETGPPGKYRRNRVSDWRIPPGGKSGTTKLFIKPGYKFRITQAMITNFHLPRSTLLALVAAFAGLENILAAYRYAIAKRYRFYSYGDAMLII